MSEVITLHPTMDPDHVLEQAVGVYGDCLIIGYDKEGYLDVRASLSLTTSKILLLMEQFKFKLLSGDYDPE